ncbi:MAG: SPOR domain-containing protein [Terricaulis sp.]|nr:SPOR domain-containing protein [Terricaulis sp.]
MSARSDPRAHEYEERNRFAGVIYMLLIVVAVAFGAFVWQLYSGPEIPRIAPQPGPYKTEPAPEAAIAPDAAEQGAPAPDTSAAMTPPSAVRTPAPAAATPAGPRFVANGPYLAQLAALQSAEAAEPAWNRLASRAPDLFAHARLDVERADLGSRGVYHRVRAGYFADRENANRFCERIRRMAQDCIVVAR